jgi:hypothetical protein
MQVVSNEITGPTGLSVGMGFSAPQWKAIPGNTVINAAGNNVVIRAIFDIITAIENPAGNAANATVKIFELSRRADRNTVKRALQVMKT